MTLLLAEEIAYQLRQEARRHELPLRALLEDAAEALVWLLREVEDLEGEWTWAWERNGVEEDEDEDGKAASVVEEKRG